ncbi:MAG: phytoene desaturase family protein [Planctomycetota bacterium]
MIAPPSTTPPPAQPQTTASGRSQADNASDVVVVGAGPGGLAAAILLAARGVDVTVFEAQPEIGGRTSLITLGDYHFDMGPTFFLMPYVLEEIFQAAGRRVDEFVRLIRLDPMYRLVIGQRDAAGAPTDDITIDTTQDLEEMARRIGKIDPDDGRAFGRFVEHNRAKLNAAEPILRRPIKSAFDLIRPDAISAARYINPHLTVQQFSSKFFKHPATKLAVGFQSKYLGMSPFDCPSLFTILPFIEYEFGVWHPIGGCNALMHAMAELLIELGGRIETGVPVESLDLDGRRVRGVNLGGQRRGETHRCDHAVINADASWAVKNLIPEPLRGKETDDRIDRKKYSCSTFMLYLGVEGEVDLPHHTIRTAPHYEQNLEDIGRANGTAGSLTKDPSFYVCNPSRTDETLAPEGHSSVYVLLPTPNTKAPVDWSEQAGPTRDLLFDRMKHVIGVDLEDRVREQLVLTPDHWAAKNINHGATFNLAHSLDQMLHKRPQHRLPYVDGAWLVGGGTHPGSGLPTIFLSAQITAGMLLDDLPAPAERPQAQPAPAGANA